MDFLRIAARVAVDQQPDFLAEWDKVSGKLFDITYEHSGLTKHDIEEMATDREYETGICYSVVVAYEEWSADPNTAPDWNALSEEQKILVATSALNNGKYGSYRGSLPESLPEVLSELKW